MPGRSTELEAILYLANAIGCALQKSGVSSLTIKKYDLVNLAEQTLRAATNTNALQGLEILRQGYED